MNILTKISVVVLVVLVLFGCVTMINMAVVPPNYKDQYAAEKARNEGFAQHAQQAQLVAKRLQSDLELERANAKNVGDTSSKDLTARTRELEEAKNENASLKVSLGKLNTSMEKLAADQVALGLRNEALAKELNEERKSKNDVAAEARQSSDKLNQATLELERRDKQMDFQKEEIDRLKQVVSDLESKKGGVASATATDGTPSGPAPKVNGTLTAIKGGIASINIGSTKGVKQGMMFMIYREGQFVAELEVREVDDSAAAGVVVKKKLDPMQGDKVQSIER